jgi:hypothetical protein
MNSQTTTVSTAPDVLDDVQAVADAVAAGRRVDAGVAARIRERSEKIQAQLLREHGVREIAVELVRQGREE